MLGAWRKSLLLLLGPFFSHLSKECDDYMKVTMMQINTRQTFINSVVGIECLKGSYWNQYPLKECGEFKCSI